MVEFQKGQIPKKARITVTLDPGTIERLEACAAAESEKRGTHVKLSSYLNEFLIRTLPKRGNRS